MANRMIQPVTGNKDKRRTYSEQMGRYARDMGGAFYLEALLIDYAMLEVQVSLSMEYARFLDTQERVLKKGGAVRKSVNAPKA